MLTQAIVLPLRFKLTDGLGKGKKKLDGGKGKSGAGGRTRARVRRLPAFLRSLHERHHTSELDSTVVSQLHNRSRREVAKAIGATIDLGDLSRQLKQIWPGRPAFVDTILDLVDALLTPPSAAVLVIASDELEPDALPTNTQVCACVCACGGDLTQFDVANCPLLPADSWAKV